MCCHRATQLYDRLDSWNSALGSRTARGEIVEGVYTADSEHRLRRELEEKGMYVLSLQPRSGLASLLPSAVTPRACRGRSSSSSTRSWRRCSRPGWRSCPSLDILRQRVANVTFKGVLDDVYERVKAGSALSDAFAEHGTMFPAGLLGVADGGGAQR